MPERYGREGDEEKVSGTFQVEELRVARCAEGNAIVGLLKVCACVFLSG
jgi:hypothetical protein